MRVRTVRTFMLGAKTLKYQQLTGGILQGCTPRLHPPDFSAEFYLRVGWVAVSGIAFSPEFPMPPPYAGGERPGRRIAASNRVD
jgi:hypothetical protein